MPKYLMIDHGGVLDGTVRQTDADVLPTDLVYHQDADCFYVLPNGKEIIELLAALTTRYGFQIIFHSANSYNDQTTLWQRITEACKPLAIETPKISGLVVFDKNLTTVSCEQPNIVSDYEIPYVTFSADADQYSGKSHLRKALSVMLAIAPEQKGQHIILDDGPAVIEKACEEGYQAYLINEKTSLLQALQAIEEQESKQLNLLKPAPELRIYSQSFLNNKWYWAGLAALAVFGVASSITGALVLAGVLTLSFAAPQAVFTLALTAIVLGAGVLLATAIGAVYRWHQYQQAKLLIEEDGYLGNEQQVPLALSSLGQPTEEASNNILTNCPHPLNSGSLMDGDDNGQAPVEGTRPSSAGSPEHTQSKNP